MPSTVRLAPALEHAQKNDCATQELGTGQVDPAPRASAHHQAFEQAGLIGCIDRSGERDAGAAADKAAVRAKSTERQARRAAAASVSP